MRRKAQVNQAVKRHRQRYPDKASERDHKYYITHREEINRRRREKRRQSAGKDDDE